MQLVAFKQYGVQLDATKIRKRHLRTLGFNVVNDVFADNSWYFRNALVRANYSDLTQGITETTIYLVNFFRSMLLGEEHDLRNRMMHIEWKKTQDITEIQSANNTVQSAKTEENPLSKCKNCTLEEMALLRIVKTILSLRRKRWRHRWASRKEL